MSGQPGDVVARVAWLEYLTTLNPMRMAIGINANSGFNLGAIDAIRSIKIDNTDVPFDVIVVFGDTGDTILCPAHSTVVSPVYTNGVTAVVLAQANFARLATATQPTTIIALSNTPAPASFTPGNAEIPFRFLFKRLPTITNAGQTATVTFDVSSTQFKCHARIVTLFVGAFGDPAFNVTNVTTGFAGAGTVNGSTIQISPSDGFPATQNAVLAEHSFTIPAVPTTVISSVVYTLAPGTANVRRACSFAFLNWDLTGSATALNAAPLFSSLGFTSRYDRIGVLAGMSEGGFPARTLSVSDEDMLAYHVFPVAAGGPVVGFGLWQIPYTPADVARYAFNAGVSGAGAAATAAISIF